jgi:hypothetical protein
LLPPLSRSKQIAPGTIGMTASRILKPRPCSASQACTPPAASSPSAEPPDSAMASISWTVLSGLRRPVLAGPGPAAAHVDRGDGGGIENDCGHAGGERGVVGVADANAGNVGDEIFQRACPSGLHLAGPFSTDISAARIAQLASASRIILASSDLR